MRSFNFLRVAMPENELLSDLSSGATKQVKCAVHGREQQRRGRYCVVYCDEHTYELRVVARFTVIDQHVRWFFVIPFVSQG